MKKFILSALVVSLFSMSANAAMTTIIDDPADVEDTWIWAAAPTLAFGGNDTFRVQGPPSAGPAHGLIKFAGIPLGVTIDSADLILRTHDDTTGAEDGITDDTLSVHRVIDSWDETTSFGTFGGSFDATADGTIAPTIQDMMVTVDVTSLVQEWSNGVTNQGLMLRGDGMDGASFDTSEGSFSPRLQITYTAVPEPTAFLMLGLVGLGFGGSRWWKSRKANK